MTPKEMSREELARALAQLQEKEKEKEKERLLHHDLQVHQIELELQNRELREAQSALEASRARFVELYDFAPVAYYTFDARGLVQEVNLTGATMVRRERARIVGVPFLALVKMPSPEAFWAHLRRCADERSPIVSEMRFAIERDQLRDVQVVSAPVFDPAGRPIAFRTSFTDITQLKQAEAALERSREEQARLRKRFEDLDRASLAFGRVLSRVGVPREHELLQQIVDEARRIAGAELAALGIGCDPDRVFDPWVYSGMDPAIAGAIGRRPRPRGVLGEVVRAGASMRLRDLREHAAFAGLPAHHPEMRSFLGVPIRVGDRVIGNLYLTNKRSAEEFSDDDQRVVEMFAERAGVAMEIARLSQELRNALDARDNLLAVVSHDLRSPLSAIQLSANLLSAKGPGGDPGCRKQLDVIARSTERMTRLIDDLLEAATIEAGSFTVELAREQVGPIVDLCVEAAEPSAASESARILREVPETLPAISCDRMRVIQVLSNLIGNAIKFVPEGGTIRIRAWPQPGEVRFAVSDDGPGIAEDDVRYIFDRYWKGEAKGRRGTGLGLYIARGIVDAHGGRIWVDSQLGAGTTVSFTIPIADHTEPHAPPR